MHVSRKKQAVVPPFITSTWRANRLRRGGAALSLGGVEVPRSLPLQRQLAAAASIGLDKREGVPLRHALIPVGFTLFVRPFPQCTLPAQGGCIGEQGGQTTYSLQE